jgi:hypothetical protein
MEQTVVQSVLEKPLFTPSYLNMEYVFSKIVESVRPIIDFITDPNTWANIGIISVILTILCLAVIIWSLVRMVEIQIFDKEEIEHEIHTALLKQKERERMQILVGIIF